MKNTLRPILPVLLLLLLFSGFSACSGAEEQNQNTNTDIDAGSDADTEPDPDEPTCQDGVLNGLETDVDCGGHECDACDIDARCEDNTDCSSGLCSLDGVCLAAPTCDDGVRNYQETDVDCGGSNCPSCPDGDRCEIDTDCENDYCSSEGFCGTPTCDDLVQNSEETDVDCGGPECPACPDGNLCQIDTDCESSLCAADGLCASCDDGVQNDQETDVDCGGPNCTSCAIGASCLVNSDCESSSCAADGRCAAPACDDGIQNGTETDVDCGGPDCIGCEGEQSCLVDADCITQECRDDDTCAPVRWSTVSTSVPGHTCATRTDGTLWCWGNNSHGQLGIDSTDDSPTPVRVGTSYNWSDVSVGLVHTCAIRTDGSLWCWGINSWGRLGLGPENEVPPGSNLTPSRVGNNNNWNNISAGETHTCATDNSGFLWCWGSNFFGTIQPNGSGEYNSPYQVSGPNRRLGDSKGNHVCTIEDNDSISQYHCQGANHDGQLGNGQEDQAHISYLYGGAIWRIISAGQDNTCGTEVDNSLWCWGEGFYGITGPSYDNKLSPVALGDPDANWTEISLNYRHACAIQFDDNSLWCWGTNAIGEVAPTNIGDRITSLTRYGSDTWETVSVGDRYTCAINTDGELWCWGLNDKGQLGDGTTTDRSAPVEVTLP